MLRFLTGFIVVLPYQLARLSDCGESSRPTDRTAENEKVRLRCFKP